MCAGVAAAVDSAACAIASPLQRLQQRAFVCFYSSHFSCLHASILTSLDSTAASSSVGELAVDLGNWIMLAVGLSAAQLLLLFVCFVGFSQGMHHHVAAAVLSTI